MKLTKLLPIFIITASVVISICFYRDLPLKMASHWGLNGEVNGYMSKFWGLFFTPITSLILYIILKIVPKIDPKIKDSHTSNQELERLTIVILIFLFYLHLLMIFWNLGYRINMTQLLSPAFCLLIYNLAIVFGDIKRNYFVGIKTPWTLENEDVWNKTHKQAAKGFKIIAVLGIFGIIWPNIIMALMIILILFFSLYLFWYSYNISRNK
jgi:uncharacterized membrane protein